MGDSKQERVVVYRGLEANALNMVEAMLDAEGMQPHRLGRANPALAGIGMHALEQRISVPAEHGEAARALIEQSEQVADADQAAKLEQQAVDAEPIPSERPPLPSDSGPDLDGKSNGAREAECRRYLRSMPGAEPVRIGVGDAAIYRSCLWHTGNYSPERRRATLHHGLSTPASAAFGRKFADMKVVVNNEDRSRA